MITRHYGPCSAGPIGSSTGPRPAVRPLRRAGETNAGGLEGVGGGGDLVEVGAGVGAEAAEIEVGVALDPAHGDLFGLPVARLGLGVGGPRRRGAQARQD